MRSSLIVLSKITSCLTGINVASRNVAFLFMPSVKQNTFPQMWCIVFNGIHICRHSNTLRLQQLLSFPFLEQNTIVLSNITIYQLFCLSLAHKFNVSGNG